MNARIRRTLILGLLTLAATLYTASEAFRSWTSHTLLLFTAHSTEQMTGYLNTTAFPAAHSIGLAAWKALLPPLDHRILLFANRNAFGAVAGACLSFVGRFLGAWLAYEIAGAFRPARLLPERVSQRLCGKARFDEAMPVFLLRLLPLPFDVASFIGGWIAPRRGWYLAISGSWIAAETLLYTAKGGYFPVPWETNLLAVRAVASAALLFFFLRTK